MLTHPWEPRPQGDCTSPHMTTFAAPAEKDASQRAKL